MGELLFGNCEEFGMGGNVEYFVFGDGCCVYGGIYVYFGDDFFFFVCF